MRAGAGKAVIAFPAGFFPAEGFDHQLDALHVRALALDAGARLALISVEMTSLPPDEIAQLKAIVSDETGIKRDHCWVMVSHTFSAPHILPDHALPDESAREKRQMLVDALRGAVRRAARVAAGGMREARLSLGQAECRVNANRDIELPEGWWIGQGGRGPSDHELTLLRLEDMDGNPIARLVHFAAQSSALDGHEAVSGDLAGRLSAGLEQTHGGVALFLLGAAGDQAPVQGTLTELAGQMIESAIEADLRAKPLPEARMQLAKTTFRVPGQVMPKSIHELHPTRTYDYMPDDERQVELEMMSIGELALIGTRPELNCLTARQIREQSPFAHTLILTMLNGGAKYMADADSYDRLTYEARNSPFAKGAAELLLGEAIRLLNPASGGM